MAKIEIDEEGTKRYYDQRGNWHRDDGPAAIFKNGYRAYSRCGVLYLMALERGENFWYNLNYPHRIHQPAYDCPNGLKVWWNNGDKVWPTLE